LGSSGPDAGDMPTAIVLHDLNSNIRKPQAFHFFLDYFGNLPLLQSGLEYLAHGSQWQRLEDFNTLGDCCPLADIEMSERLKLFGVANLPGRS